MDLETQLDEFRRHLTVERRVSPLTTTTYFRDLQALARYLAESDRPNDAAALTVRDLRGFLAKEGDGAKAATVRRKVAALRAFYRFLVRRGLSSTNPASELHAPKLRHTLPRFLTVEHAGEAVEAPTGLGATASHLRDRAMLEVLYGSGLRVSELVGLDVRDVSLSQGSARVLGKGSKQRIVPLGSKARDALAEYLGVRAQIRHPKGGHQDPSALFLGQLGRRIGVRQVQMLVKKYGAWGAGRSDVHPHALRHTCATHLLDAGADLRSIQELLGHASLSSTQRYTHVSMDQIQAVYSGAHPLGRPEKPPV